MTKRYTHVPIGNATRHTVTLSDEPSHGPEIPGRQFAFLSEWVNNGVYNGLFACGPIPFQAMTMKHDGEKWVITMTSVEGDQ